MVAVARALSGDVRVLLLDEPVEGLAPAVVEQLFETFDRLRKEIAIIIVDHHLDLALALSDSTVALERGRVIHQGPSKAFAGTISICAARSSGCEPTCRWWPATNLVAIPLFGLDACELDHPRPLFGGIREDRPEFRRRAPQHCTAQLDDPGFDFAIGEAGIELFIQQIDDFGRGALGAPIPAKPNGSSFMARASFGTSLTTVARRSSPCADAVGRRSRARALAVRILHHAFDRGGGADWQAIPSSKRVHAVANRQRHGALDEAQNKTFLAVLSTCSAPTRPGRSRRYGGTL